MKKLIPVCLMNKIKKEHVESCDVGLTYDIIDESLSMPIIVAPTNPSRSTSTFTSSSSEGIGFLIVGALNT